MLDLNKENIKLKKQVDNLTSEIKEIKETLKLISSQEREVKKSLNENKLNRSPEESAKFIEDALKADEFDCKDTNLLNELTKDYLREFVCDMRIGHLTFQPLLNLNMNWYRAEKGKIDYNDFFHDEMRKESPFYRTAGFFGNSLVITKKPHYAKIVNYLENFIIKNADKRGKFEELELIDLNKFSGPVFEPIRENLDPDKDAEMTGVGWLGFGLPNSAYNIFRKQKVYVLRLTKNRNASQNRDLFDISHAFQFSGVYRLCY